MKNHIRLFTLCIGILLTCIKADAICELTNKDSSVFSYNFICDGNNVGIKCKSKDEEACEVEIRTKLMSYSFKIDKDKFESMDLFDKAKQSKSMCLSKSNICKIDSSICGNYTNAFARVERLEFENLGPKKRCDVSGLGSIKEFGGVSTQIVAGNEFVKKDCNAGTDGPLVGLAEKLEIFRRNIFTDLSSSRNLLNGCLEGAELHDRKEKLINDNRANFELLRKLIAGKIQDLKLLREFVCSADVNKYYSNEKLDIDKLVCLLIEDSKIGLNFKTEIVYDCQRSADSADNATFAAIPYGLNTYRTDSAKTASDLDAASRTVANADTTTAEQKPLPAIIKASTETPIGLAPALAKVEQIAPGNQGLAQEGQIASGAVRGGISPDVATDAGRAFEPVYQKLSAMAGAVSNLGSSRTETLIGKGGTSSNGNSVVARNSYSGTVRIPQSETNAGILGGKNPPPTGDEATIAAKGGQAQIKTPIRDSILKTGTSTNSSGVGSSAAGTGPNVLSRNSISDSSGAQKGTVNPDVIASGGPLAIESVASLQNRISQLKTPAQVKSFFELTAKKIPGFRQLIYGDDPEIQKLLKDKKIKIVAKDGRVSPRNFESPEYVFSDNGTNFIPIVAKK